MDIITAKAIPIDEFLQRLGYGIVRTVGGCHWYRSPTRQEKTPSFKLTPDARGWYDHVTGEGGNILDLAYRLHTGRPLMNKLDGQQVKEALGFIEERMGISYHPAPSRLAPASSPVESTFTLLGHIPFVVHTPAGTLTPAARYLAARGIEPQRVAPYLEDINFAGRDGRKRYGFGLPNRAGGYEIRRADDWAKRSVGTKDITLFEAGRAMAPWHTFYSLIDFCTFLTVDKPPLGAYHYLILNSDSLVERAIAYLSERPAGFMIHYPHQDESGQRAYEKLLGFLTGQGWNGGNQAGRYAGFKDWTEARQHQLTESKGR